jgi:hypothetical protein
LAAGCTIYRYYHQFYAKPDALFSHLIAVSKQQESLKSSDIDVEALQLDAYQIIRTQIMDDLDKTDLPEVGEHADLLLPNAVSFLEDESEMLTWLTSLLQGMIFRDTSTYEDETGRKVLTDDEVCLVIERVDGHWLWVSMLDCQS